MTSTSFRSKVDAWLVMVIVGVFASVGLLSARVSMSAASLAFVAVWAGVGVGVGVGVGRKSGLTWPRSTRTPRRGRACARS